MSGSTPFRFGAHDDLERCDSQMAGLSAPGSEMVAELAAGGEDGLPTSPKGLAELPAVVTPCVAIDAAKDIDDQHQIMRM